MSKIQVLLAEDELALGMIIQESLESRDFKVRLCEDGQKAWESYQSSKPDILILDVMMPKKDGFSLAEEIRKIDPYTPIIFLTSKSQTEDVVKGFGLGANDYVRKPFSMEELIVRIKAHLDRLRTRQNQNDWLPIGQYEFHPTKQILRIKDSECPLTARESQLLQMLLENANDITDRTLILNQIWGSDDFFNARSMDVFITKLRKKLQDDPEIQILNIRGYGFKLVC
ncbi:DNA-binding response regulator, OmpR family, contains REC and winged-helix (wHTH) domain [Algoriphagus ornithinivorans]|mgnify:CR=1 FL=1|jgi:DNA-binding response OmpR family regulator|uniref:DNA-binding response regulator, OmpR family, contains REC and winged-helix (WHTH) domain n=3 Tax=Algoriphagus TaxID=246875 RepID=A0A1I5I532_9BACT|nr:MULTISPECIES: response regulator transcription factor [Algoriphagus]MAL14201.1 DNA-binding response regulator [Algoriphagus sp.]MAN88127.1 DNA-binding response regulator [Algoriphagus sp.]QYH37463.1 response regulator transcription factor [Algoriphagus sp. NBT04N3]SFO55685.1 DNA-binding response regulator, OmpR family, contains REC and winged-helix (wHTH) domain [Algoriphagus ornithinivorans]HAD49963.1 DNA-binding response regulator [Algoriphagus sp.]|tara:strand:- start:188 stop:868 length:681 start_codon:yes stop_codon:yes gene_type:complete